MMASKCVFMVALLLAAVQADQSRIAGGSLTSIERYPSIVQVDFRNGIMWNHNCGANIINDFYVLSAAHCFEGIFFTASSRRIRAGSSNRNTGGIVVGVNRIHNHPSYGRGGHDGDITVVRLSSRLIYGPTIQQIGLLEQGFQLPDNLPVVHAGWGHVNPGGRFSANLRHVQIYTINRELCRRRYAPHRGSEVTANMICAGLLDVGGADACQGDSGGPMYYGNMLVGVISWGGRYCADPFYPGVSTAVSSYTNWIISVAV